MVVALAAGVSAVALTASDTAFASGSVLRAAASNPYAAAPNSHASVELPGASALAVPTVAGATAARGLDGCVGQLVTVDRATRVMTHDLTGTAKGATVSLRGSDGRLGYTPKAFAFAGEAGDIGQGIRVHFAVTPSGRLNRLSVITRMQGEKYVATMRSKQIGRGFAPVAMAAAVDPLSEDSGFVYLLDGKGDLRRYSYSEGAGLGRATVVAKGLTGTRSLDFSRFRFATTSDGFENIDADVLLANDARSGALKEIVVPHAAPAKTQVANLQATGWGGYARVARLLCDSGRGGFVAVRPNGTGAAFSDTDMADLSGTDIVKVGWLTGRPAR